MTGAVPDHQLSSRPDRPYKLEPICVRSAGNRNVYAERCAKNSKQQAVTGSIRREGRRPVQA
jgi:hypothetical protein